jgi:hypothetical protein
MDQYVTEVHVQDNSRSPRVNVDAMKVSTTNLPQDADLERMSADVPDISRPSSPFSLSPPAAQSISEQMALVRPIRGNVLELTNEHHPAIYSSYPTSGFSSSTHVYAGPVKADNAKIVSGDPTCLWALLFELIEISDVEGQETECHLLHCQSLDSPCSDAQANTRS